MLQIKLWVDADALPNEIKEIILRAARRLRVETVFVANKNVWVGDDPLVSFVRVTEGPDVADAYIVEASASGDLCVGAAPRRPGGPRPFRGGGGGPGVFVGRRRYPPGRAPGR